MHSQPKGHWLSRRLVHWTTAGIALSIAGFSMRGDTNTPGVPLIAVRLAPDFVRQINERLTGFEYRFENLSFETDPAVCGGLRFDNVAGHVVMGEVDMDTPSTRTGVRAAVNIDDLRFAARITRLSDLKKPTAKPTPSSPEATSKATPPTKAKPAGGLFSSIFGGKKTDESAETDDADKSSAKPSSGGGAMGFACNLFIDMVNNASEDGEGLILKKAHFDVSSKIEQGTLKPKQFVFHRMEAEPDNDPRRLLFLLKLFLDTAPEVAERFIQDKVNLDTALFPTTLTLIEGAEELELKRMQHGTLRADGALELVAEARLLPKKGKQINDRPCPRVDAFSSYSGNQNNDFAMPDLTTEMDSTVQLLVNEFMANQMLAQVARDGLLCQYGAAPFDEVFFLLNPSLPRGVEVLAGGYPKEIPWVSFQPGDDNGRAQVTLNMPKLALWWGLRMKHHDLIKAGGGTGDVAMNAQLEVRDGALGFSLVAKDDGTVSNFNIDLDSHGLSDQISKIPVALLNKMINQTIIPNLSNNFVELIPASPQLDGWQVDFKGFRTNHGFLEVNFDVAAIETGGYRIERGGAKPTRALEGGRG